MTAIESIEGICEVTRHGPSDAAPELLIEIPHGAVDRAEFDALRRRLRGPFPDELEAFFFVNTDIGAPEAARHIARSLADGCRVVLLRSLVPRTFVDCNRVLDDGPPVAPGQLTPGLPQYVTHDGDGTLLRSLHGQYQSMADRAYAAVCGAGGLALTLHPYAPRSVGISTVDDGIVRALRAAYEPDTYRRWPVRPPVDVIDETDDGRCLAPRDVVDVMLERYAAAGIEARRNATYRLHAGSMGHRLSLRYPGQCLCVELNRGELGDPFVPFRPVTISPTAVARMADPIASALSAGIESRRRSRQSRRG